MEAVQAKLTVKIHTPDDAGAHSLVHQRDHFASDMVQKHLRAIQVKECLKFEVVNLNLSVSVKKDKKK